MRPNSQRAAIVFSIPLRRKAVAKRPRFSRWRRLPGVFRTGDQRPDTSGSQLDRIILYVPARILDLAESLAEKAGVPSIQDYCGLLLMRAIENERVRQKVADIELRRGPLEGFNEITDDPHYLAEWRERSDEKADPQSSITSNETSIFIDSQPVVQPLAVDVIYPDREAVALDPPAARSDPEPDPAEPEPEPERPQIRLVPLPSPDVVRPAIFKPVGQLMNDRSAAEILSCHVGLGEDESGFLPCLRRGEPVPAARMAELEGALVRIEEELRGCESLDRRIAHGLHRLALESQVLLTDLWPGVFDAGVIQSIRTVQEAVERILSGQDIRYYRPVQTAAERPN
jgi:hypothetical protein